MLDINLFRVEKGGNPELIRESQRRRFANVELVDEVIAIDKQWRQRKNLYLFLSTNLWFGSISVFWIWVLVFFFFWVAVQFDLENLRKDFNKINKQVAQLRIVSLLIFFLSFRVFRSYFFILGSTSFLALRCL